MCVPGVSPVHGDIYQDSKMGALVKGRRFKDGASQRQFAGQLEVSCRVVGSRLLSSDSLNPKP